LIFGKLKLNVHVFQLPVLITQTKDLVMNIKYSLSTPGCSKSARTTTMSEAISGRDGLLFKSLRLCNPGSAIVAKPGMVLTLGTL